MFNFGFGLGLKTSVVHRLACTWYQLLNHKGNETGGGYTCGTGNPQLCATTVPYRVLIYEAQRSDIVTLNKWLLYPVALSEAESVDWTVSVYFGDAGLPASTKFIFSNWTLFCLACLSKNISENCSHHKYQGDHLWCITPPEIVQMHDWCIMIVVDRVYSTSFTRL